MADFEQQGYDAWVEMWVRDGCSPSASSCPARWMNDSPKRTAFIKGWNRASDENTRTAPIKEHAK